MRPSQIFIAITGLCAVVTVPAWAVFGCAYETIVSLIPRSLHEPGFQYSLKVEGGALRLMRRSALTVEEDQPLSLPIRESKGALELEGFVGLGAKAEAAIALSKIVGSRPVFFIHNGYRVDVSPDDTVRKLQLQLLGKQQRGERASESNNQEDTDFKRLTIREIDFGAHFDFMGMSAVVEVPESADWEGAWVKIGSPVIRKKGNLIRYWVFGLQPDLDVPVWLSSQDIEFSQVWSNLSSRQALDIVHEFEGFIDFSK